MKTHCLNLFKLIDTTEPTIPPVDNEPKIKFLGSFRWIETNYAVVRKLISESHGHEIGHLGNFCPYDKIDDKMIRSPRWVLLCESTLQRLSVSS